VLEAGFAVTCVPPLAGVIAYSSGRGDDPFEDGFDEDIFLRNADGTSIRNLTNTPTEDERQPVWSPDGLQLAFMPLEGTDIFVMSADGSNRRLLLGGLDGAGGLQWSPDGTRLLFAQFNADFDAEVTMYSFSTNRLQVLARASVSESLSGFCWSHDGARVAYSVVDFEPEPRTSVLYTVSVAGGTPTQIVAVSGSELTLPAWSPDDGTIAFLQEGVDQRNDIYLVAADGSSPAVNLTNNPGVYRSLAWSPDGQTLAFSNGGLFSSVSNEGLFTIDRSGNLRQLTLNEARGISWSEDGSRLLFEESFEIYLINFDGTGRRAITADGFLNSEASWRP
jgi:Tol biopolymer transport system component